MLPDMFEDLFGPFSEEASFSVSKLCFVLRSHSPSTLAKDMGGQLRVCQELTAGEEDSDVITSRMWLECLTKVTDVRFTAFVCWYICDNVWGVL